MVFLALVSCLPWSILHYFGSLALAAVFLDLLIAGLRYCLHPWLIRELHFYGWAMCYSALTLNRLHEWPPCCSNSDFNFQKCV